MSFHRNNRTRDFTVMGNIHLRDKNLSLKAVGLLSKMLSFNDSWQFSTRGLAAICKEGPDAILSTLKELEENGYIVRHRSRDDKGRLVTTEFDIYESPQAGLPHGGNPHRENPDVDNPDMDNPCGDKSAQINTDQVITQERNTLSKNYQSINLDGMDRMDERSEYEEIIKENLDYDILCQDPKFDKDRFREIMDIMLDAVCSTAPTIRINGEDMLADFLEMDSNITVNFHIRTIDQAKAIKSIKMKITDLDKMKIEEQKKAVRSGYDMDIIPSDLATFGGEAKRLLQDLQTRNERLFLVTILIMNTATNRQKLENAVFQTAAIAQKYNCALKRLDFQQEEGLMSSLPIGINQVEIERGLTTSSTAVFMPFSTQEFFQGGEALYYGLNALSNNMIMVDRKQLKNPNGLYHKGTGTPRKTQARAPFAAQTDRERRKRAEMKNIQKVFGTGSDLYPVFLLFVRGRFRTAQAPDCPVRKQERSFATFYTNRLQNSMRKGAAA